MDYIKEQKQIRDYIFRASEIGSLFSGSKKGLTDAEKKKKDELEYRQKYGKPLTVKMEETLNMLKEKEKSPLQLGAGTKTFLKQKVLELITGRKNELFSKYLDKGIYVEDKSIELLNEIIGTNYTKNKKRFSNKYITGEPDVFDTDKVIDIKSSWDLFTFPTIDDNLNLNYVWQIKSYAVLLRENGLNIKNGYVIHLLTDTPEHIVLNELYRYANKYGYIDLPESIENEIRARHSYSDLPPELRINISEVELLETDKDAIIEYVETARLYMIEYLRMINEKSIKL